MKQPKIDTQGRFADTGSGVPSVQAATFLDSLQRWLRTNGGVRFGTEAQRTDSTARGYLAPGDVADGTLFVETDTGLVYQWRLSSERFVRPSGSWVLILGQVIDSRTLSAASTAISAPADGSEWILILKQDATGGRAITWGAGIIAASTSLGTALADSYSVFHFIKSGSSWFQVAQQTVDMT